MSVPPPIINVHTPTASFGVVHSVTEESMVALLDKITKKAANEYAGARVDVGWVKYEWNDAVWNLDDEADYTIFAWRQKTFANQEPSGSNAPPSYTPQSQPTLYVHNPAQALPSANAYRNPAFYLFQRPTSPAPTTSRSQSGARSTRSKKSAAPPKYGADGAEAKVPAHKQAFDKFHSENGVRTVTGTIGPVPNVRMLLKTGHRHVYVSRKFAVRHGFVPRDAAPGQYGYGGLVNIGKWPITLGATPSTDPLGRPPKSVVLPVYLSEEPHFDVILGRSFHEIRRVRTDPCDPTDVRCMDTGEKVECEVVVLRDGRGEIVTVT